MQNHGMRTSRFYLENSENGKVADDLGKRDKLKQEVPGGRSLPSSNSVSFNNRPQWPRSYQNAMNNRIVGGPDVSQVFKKIMESVGWVYEFILERKRACLPACLP
ncbi:hypothetical protein MPTK1_2g00990 [Marchantia polymorpha subsp. ruderalis]|uniref:Uncharacterized protein n=1 Tax=Marchantia polymorpha TaxID=3197 RepID=A0A2R6X9H4_MARPO|nr:hypothetical protein MARPO_0028s0052 [Marchantia polymorpha]PTQ42735.1 hypothetical protein MARPO_0028s0052 [Marchantia polymorpha]BBN00661.1 hypothetical protein Mp_2g00990 [Marchantia polymorpha subsp. ruderalis]BBN00662.1 hypothetical protein Mp_2g00990 [Marchantia polymorpha subsp. ruderalis]|eukprot:PTQ42734.1 hypothetical protein MARPO_0028s0052 [Marchantia polymorpha]